MPVARPLPPTLPQAARPNGRRRGLLGVGRLSLASAGRSTCRNRGAEWRLPARGSGVDGAVKDKPARRCRPGAAARGGIGGGGGGGEASGAFWASRRAVAMDAAARILASAAAAGPMLALAAEAAAAGPSFAAAYTAARRPPRRRCTPGHRPVEWPPSAPFRPAGSAPPVRGGLPGLEQVGRVGAPALELPSMRRIAARLPLRGPYIKGRVSILSPVVKKARSRLGRSGAVWGRRGRDRPPARGERAQGPHAERRKGQCRGAQRPRRGSPWRAIAAPPVGTRRRRGA